MKGLLREGGRAITANGGGGGGGVTDGHSGVESGHHPSISKLAHSCGHFR